MEVLGGTKSILWLPDILMYSHCIAIKLHFLSNKPQLPRVNLFCQLAHWLDEPQVNRGLSQLQFKGTTGVILWHKHSLGTKTSESAELKVAEIESKMLQLGYQPEKNVISTPWVLDLCILREKEH